MNNYYILHCHEFVHPKDATDPDIFVPEGWCAIWSEKDNGIVAYVRPNEVEHCIWGLNDRHAQVPGWPGLETEDERKTIPTGK